MLFGPPDVQKLAKKRDLKGLIRALAYQKDKRIQKEAIEALGNLSDSSAVVPLLEAAQSDDGDLRDAAIRALARLGDKRAFDTLLAAVQSAEKIGPYSSLTAVMETLGAWADPRALETLIQAYKHCDYESTENWVRAVRPFFGEDYRKIYEAGLFQTLQARDLVRLLGQAGLAAALKDEQTKRAALKAALGSVYFEPIRDQQIIDALMELYAEPDLRLDVAKTLASTSGLSAFWLKAYQDENAEVSACALEAMLRHREPGTKDLLCQILVEGNYDGARLEALSKALKSLGWQPTTDIERAYAAVGWRDEALVLSLGVAAMPALRLVTIKDQPHAEKPYYVWGAAVLEKLLQREPKQLTTDDLQAISQLQDAVLKVTETGRDGEIIGYSDWKFECPKVRELAEQELARRG